MGFFFLFYPLFYDGKQPKKDMYCHPNRHPFGKWRKG